MTFSRPLWDRDALDIRRFLNSTSLISFPGGSSVDSDPLSRRSSPSSNSDTNVTLEPMTTSISEVLTSLQRHPAEPAADAEDRMRFRSLPNRNNRLPPQVPTGNGNRDFVNGNAKFGMNNNSGRMLGGSGFGNPVEDLYAKVRRNDEIKNLFF